MLRVNQNFMPNRLRAQNRHRWIDGAHRERRTTKRTCTIAGSPPRRGIDAAPGGSYAASPPDCCRAEILSYFRGRLSGRGSRKRGRQLDSTDDNRVALALRRRDLRPRRRASNQPARRAASPPSTDFLVGVADSVPVALACRLLEQAWRCPRAGAPGVPRRQSSGTCCPSSRHRPTSCSPTSRCRQGGVKAFNHALGRWR